MEKKAKLALILTSSGAKNAATLISLPALLELSLIESFRALYRSLGVKLRSLWRGQELLGGNFYPNFMESIKGGPGPARGDLNLNFRNRGQMLFPNFTIEMSKTNMKLDLFGNKSNFAKKTPKVGDKKTVKLKVSFELLNYDIQGRFMIAKENISHENGDRDIFMSSSMHVLESENHRFLSRSLLLVPWPFFLIVHFLLAFRRRQF